jgi:hypothetical protein
VRTVICHFYNEEYLLPFWLKHHRDIFDHGILINYKSTDNSVDLIRKHAPPTWEIVDSINDTFNAQLCDLEVMQHERRIKGWKIVLNVTEFFVCPNINLIEQDCEKVNLNGFRAIGVVLVDNTNNIKVDSDVPLIEQKNHGFTESNFNYDAIKLSWSSGPLRNRTYHNNETGLYLPGRHKSLLSKILTVNDGAYIFWFAFSPWNSDFLKRKIQIDQRLDPDDISKGWGYQHTLDYGQLDNIRNVFLKQSYSLADLIKESKIPRKSYFSNPTEILALYDDLAKLETSYHQLETQNDQLETQNDQLETQNNQLETQIYQKDKQNAEQLALILNSLSWRLTKPLRYLKSKISKGIKFLNKEKIK